MFHRGEVGIYCVYRCQGVGQGLCGAEDSSQLQNSPTPGHKGALPPSCWCLWESVFKKGQTAVQEL